MEFIILLLVIILGGWLWRNRQSDKQTTLDFDVWLDLYDKTDSPFKQSRMAVAFLNQSLHMAWTTGAINSKQREVIASIMKQQRAINTMLTWLGSALPLVTHVIGKQELSNIPARSIGMLMLIVWMSPQDNREEELRQFLGKLTGRAHA